RDLPFLWGSSANDYDKDGNNTEDAQRSYDDYVAGGGPGVLIETPEIPVNPLRMMRHEKYYAEESQAAFDELVALGVITAEGDRIPTIEEHEQALKDYTKNSVLDGPERVA